MANGKCKKCGSEISADASPRGICAKCLIRLALEAPGEDDRPEPKDTAAVISDVTDQSQSIGPYRILQKLGEGGMGIVYQAEQREPIRRTVALKLIKAGMDTAQVVARFESERQALAMMDHPGIARVFDAGSTQQGRPYFVMEYVKGEPITTYCDRNRLTTDERLELFRRVCDAVQHAHQKGVIHRDLKPSNVLVAEENGEPVAKIIDFGVAKATQQRLTERTLYTEFGAMVGTPEYMSPEQARVGPSDIDTRSDVYSLGILLYELLVGALPFDPRELRQAGFEEICRRIREEEPSKPSARLTTLGDESGISARTRRTDPKSLERELRGDLDWIVMKALEKEPSRRYGSASDFAEDIRRHVSHEPVVAGPPSRGYRIRKFVRRHRIGVIAAALVLTTLVIGVIGTTYGLVRSLRAEREVRTEAETSARVTEFLVALFNISNPSQARGERVLARDLLDDAADRVETELLDQPEVQARLMHTMGSAYRGLGMYEQAEARLGGALNRRRELFGEDHEITLDTLEEYGDLLIRLSRYDEAKVVLEQVRDTRRSTLGEQAVKSLEVTAALARAHYYLGEHEAALALFETALEGQSGALSATHPATLKTMNWLAIVHERLGQLDKAEELFRETLETQTTVQGRDHPDTLWCMYGLASLYHYRGNYQDAESYYRENLELRSKVLGPDHQDTLWTVQRLGDLYMMRKRLDEAEPLLAAALESRRRVLGDAHKDTAISRIALGYLYRLQGRLEEAELLTSQALDAFTAQLGPAHHSTLNAMHNLGEIKAAQGSWEDAERLYLITLTKRSEVLGAEHPEVIETLYGLANLRRDLGNYDEARSLYREALEIAGKKFEPSHWRITEILTDSAAMEESLGRTAEAEALRNRIVDPPVPPPS